MKIGCERKWLWKSLFFLLLLGGLTGPAAAAETGLWSSKNKTGALLLLDGISVLTGDTANVTDGTWKVRYAPMGDTKPVRKDLDTTWNMPGVSLTRRIVFSDRTAEFVHDMNYREIPDGKMIENSIFLSDYAADFLRPLLKKGILNFKTLTVSLGGRQVEITGKGDGVWSLCPNGNNPDSRIRFRYQQPVRAAQFRQSASLTFRVFPEEAVPEAELPGAFGTSFVPGVFPPDALRNLADDENHSGWTGQGPGNDLGNLRSGVRSVFGVPFLITGKAVLLRSAKARNFPLTSGKITFGKPARFRTFLVLHTGAWSAAPGSPVARYRVEYQDGSSQEFPVRYGMEIFDWWFSGALSNARVGIRVTNGQGQPVGVFFCRLGGIDSEKKVVSMEMISADNSCIPALLAVTGVLFGPETSPRVDGWVRGRSEASQDIRPGADYVPCKIAWDTPAQAGSALDFSSFNHKPAGKYGFLKRKGDHFEFEKKPGVAVRFWGTNFAIHGVYPDKDLAPKLAACMASQGVNLVRFHLYANRIEQLCAPDGTLHEENVDKLFFLLAELKKQGIYVYMDINDGMCYDRLLKRDATSRTAQEFLKISSFFDPELRRAVLRLVELLMLRKNPYTGLSMVEDPAVAMYECANEASMLNNFSGALSRIHDNPAYLEKLKQLWADYLRRNNLSERPLPAASLTSSPGERRFAAGLDFTYFSEVIRFMREHGLAAPISGTNICWQLALVQAQEEAGVDFFGEHYYWTSPNFGVRPPTYNDGPCSGVPVWHSPLHGDTARCAVAGYPAVIGEWNWCYPNKMRADGIPLMAAYSAYQDYDGLIYYGATGTNDQGKWNRFRDNPIIMVHSQQTDPSTWGLSRLGMMLFRRGDVATARRLFEVQVPKKLIFDEPRNVAALGFLIQYGRLQLRFGSEGNRLFEIANKYNSAETRFDALRKELPGGLGGDRRLAVSDTGELCRQPDPALFWIDTPRTRCVAGELSRLSSGKHRLGGVDVKTSVPYGTLAVSSLDEDSPMEKAGRLLLFAVGNSANTGQLLRDGAIADMGKPPVLTEPFAAEVSIVSDRPGRVYALDSVSGTRTRELPAKFEAGALSFELTGKDNTIYYEIIKGSR